MPIAPTGQLSLDAVRTELGASGPISFNDLNVRRLANQTSGVVDASNLRGTAWVGTTINNVNLVTTFGSPGAVATYKLAINDTGVVRAGAGSTALTVGQFPTGSTIQVNNWGSIQGFGGTAGTTGAGGAGGDAIFANYPNQTVVVNNNTGAVIYGGGGGGGRGGAGGLGGLGGPGTNTTYGPQYYQPTPGNGQVFYWNAGTSRKGGQFTNIYWNQPSEAAYDPTYNVLYYFANATYSLAYITYSYAGFTIGSQVDAQNWYIRTFSTSPTSGGAGGAGGAGGSGGRGQGADGAATSGLGGSGGSAGAAGGVNAGAGGTGGTGGSGGSGSSWGTAGSSGVTGNTGGTGAAGTAGAGFAGSAGVGGSGGGAAGRYLVKGSNSVTLNNNGTVAGGLA